MKKNKKKSEALARLQAPTPSFWKRIGRIGGAIVAVSTAIVAAPVALPAAIITIASYGIAVGGAAAALSQFGANTNDLKDATNNSEPTSSVQ